LFAGYWSVALARRPLSQRLPPEDAHVGPRPRQRRSAADQSAVARSARHAVSPKQVLAAGGLLLLCALPGLLPALQMLGGTSAQTAYQADFIQVYYRLNHHLDPKSFSIAAYVCYTLMFLVWTLLLRALTIDNEAERFLAWFVLGAVLIACGGLIVGLLPRPEKPMQYALALKLLKFYPFRLADVFIPLAFAAGLVGVMQKTVWIERLLHITTRNPGVKRITVPVWLVFGGLFLYAVLMPTPDRNPSRLEAQPLADWQAACRWIDAHTPADAVFHTPHRSWAFKWYAQRAEYVAFKDCPQDAAGIVEWNRRLRFLRKWGEDNHPGGYSAAELRRLHEDTGITHLIVRRLGPIHLKPIYRNQSYRVYDLTATAAQP
jgi:hypothetical protein